MNDVRTYPTRPFLAVSAAIFRDGKVLVVRRARKPALNLYTMPGGVVEAGETLAEAVAREVREETALQIEVLTLAGHREAVMRDAQRRWSSAAAHGCAGCPANRCSMKSSTKRTGSIRRRSRACAPPTAWPKSWRPRPKSSPAGVNGTALRLPQTKGISIATMRTLLAIASVLLCLTLPVRAAEGDPAPFDNDLQRLGEILGSLQYLRGICGPNEGQKWRNEMQSLIDAEAPSGERRRLIVASFNRGYRGFQQTYRTCTPAANIAIRRYLDEGAKIAREITARYAN